MSLQKKLLLSLSLTFLSAASLTSYAIMDIKKKKNMKSILKT